MPEALLCAITAAEVVDVPSWRALAVDGVGEPAAVGRERAPLDEAMDAVFAVGTAVAGLRSVTGAAPSQVGPVEVVWWLEEPRFEQGAEPTWRWRARVAVPGDVRSDEVTEAVVALAQRSGGAGRLRKLLRVVVEDVGGRRMARALHRGPADGAGPAYAMLLSAVAKGAEEPGAHWAEVHLRDVKTTPREQQRTVVLLDLDESPSPRRPRAPLACPR